MNHQVQDLTSLRLELECFRIRAHGESVARRVGGLQDGRPLGGRPPRFFIASSTKLMERRQDTLGFFDACHRSKSAPSMKNFRPIWTIRIRSSSMILRKCLTEKPAISAALGMSRNVFFTAIPSVDFIGSSFSQEENARVVPNGKSGINNLLFTHKGVSIIGRRHEIFLDCSGTNPTEQV